MRHYWSGNKYGLVGEYPRNPSVNAWRDKCPFLGGEYKGHNIAAFAVDHDGYIIDFDFNHNALFDSSVDHAEARLIRRVFSLTQLQDSWNVASQDNPADKYSNTLSKVTVYTSLESCTQCTGIMMLGRVKRVVYMQSDPGMYRVGDLFRTLTTKDKNPDYIRAPEPIAATQVGSDVLKELDISFQKFIDTEQSGPPFLLQRREKKRELTA